MGPIQVFIKNEGLIGFELKYQHLSICAVDGRCLGK